MLMESDPGGSAGRVLNHNSPVQGQTRHCKPQAAAAQQKEPGPALEVRPRQSEGEALLLLLRLLLVRILMLVSPTLLPLLPLGPAPPLRRQLAELVRSCRDGFGKKRILGSGRVIMDFWYRGARKLVLSHLGAAAAAGTAAAAERRLQHSCIRTAGWCCIGAAFTLGHKSCAPAGA